MHHTVDVKIYWISLGSVCLLDAKCCWQWQHQHWHRAPHQNGISGNIDGIRRGKLYEVVGQWRFLPLSVPVIYRIKGAVLFHESCRDTERSAGLKPLNKTSQHSPRESLCFNEWSGNWNHSTAVLGGTLNTYQTTHAFSLCFPKRDLEI